ncbi:MAG: phosphoenolpyruvate--protein phosphotransferase [Candidatus Methylacidiphilales bacterium]|nr:phosphoenolpyruvate--protein phosphotransferase [Candidatus Methylacidiphilales bacterium]
MRPPKKKLQTDVRLEGIPVSPGVARGPLVVLDREELTIPRDPIAADEVPGEMARLEAALVETRKQIQQIKDLLSESIGEKDASIFEAHLLVVEDAMLIQAVHKQLETKHLRVEYVFHHIITQYAQTMREMDDPYLAERASDILDVGKRVLNNLMGKKPVEKYHLDQPSIILAHDLSPGDTALLDRSKVLGFATDQGGPVGHTAIIARALNIPAVVGLKDASFLLSGGMDVLLDGYEGVLIVSPSEKTQFEYGQIEIRRNRVEAELETLRDTPASTTDGRKLVVSANVELIEDLPHLRENGAEGIGLYRTEFLFMNRLSVPDEEEQMAVYRKFVEASHPHPVIFRTLDCGGDKMPNNLGMEQELNPFLGWRAIRLTLQRRDIFETQLRAICRAGAGYRIRIMFPMIATIEELTEAKSILQNVLLELDRESRDRSHDIELGAMIEVPSAALIVDRIVPEVDFLSIGTNDLVQYTLACDRTNEKVAYLYQPTHPAIIALISRVVQAAHEGNIWVGVCGEMAAEVLYTPLLLGLGVDELSMGPVFIPRVKRAIQRLDYGQMQILAHSLAQMASARDVRDSIEEVALQHYPELLE